MTGVWFLTLAAVAAILLGAIARIRHEPRWRCDCGETFTSEAELEVHELDVGQCLEWSGSHVCTLEGHHTKHRCGCGIDWT